MRIIVEVDGNEADVRVIQPQSGTPAQSTATTTTPAAAGGVAQDTPLDGGRAPSVARVMPAPPKGTTLGIPMLAPVAVDAGAAVHADGDRSAGPAPVAPPDGTEPPETGGTRGRT